MYGVEVQSTDVYLFEDEAHLCTAKTAELFHTSYHNFSNVYVSNLLFAGVHRIIVGRNRYYNINESLAILVASRQRGVPVSEICDELYEINNKKQKKRRK